VTSRPEEAAAADAALVERCRAESVRLLERNLSPAGILAATPSPRSASNETSCSAAVFAVGYLKLRLRIESIRQLRI